MSTGFLGVREWLSTFTKVCCDQDGLFNPTNLIRKYEHFSHVSLPDYFLQLLELQSVDWLRLPLLQGITTSTIAGAEGLIRSTRSALIQYINIQEPNKQQETLMTTLKELSTILSDNLQDDRYAIPTVEFLAFLINSYIPSIPGGSEPMWVYFLSRLEQACTNLFPRPHSFRKLFILVQKSHFKSSNIARLEAAIKAYASFSKLEPLREDVLRKMIGMLLHPFPRVCLLLPSPSSLSEMGHVANHSFVLQVRTCVADYLYMETDSDLVKLGDWTRQPKQLKGDVETLRGVLVT